MVLNLNLTNVSSEVAGCAGAETFNGRTPALTVRTVLSIARQAELAFNHASHYESMMTMLGAYSSEPMLSQVRSPPPSPRRCEITGVQLVGVKARTRAARADGR